MRLKTTVCLYGGPGCGKSTTCAGLFYKLKLLGYNSEMIREYIKNWVWEGRPIIDGDQTYFFAKQSREERVLVKNNLDFIVTDSPLILTHFYGMKYDKMEQQSNASLNMLKNHHEFIKTHGYKVEHYVLQRAKQYNPAGRFQTHEEAIQFDTEIMAMMDSFGIKYKVIEGNENAVDAIIEDLRSKS
jgi:nicotinamide riboside kinase